MCVKFNLFVAFIAFVTIVSSQSNQATRNGLFAADIFTEIAFSHSTENVILSPVSIQTALAMVFLGAEGQTATELQTSLRLSSSNKDAVAQDFENLLQQNPGDAELVIANRFYANLGYTLNATYNALAEQYFHSEVETIDFAQSAQAADTINSWIENKTNDKIQNILDPNSLSSDTTGVIVNAIYFKGKWRSPFNKDETTNQTFWIDASHSKEVPTMHADKTFPYAELPELDATAIELPYNGSNISMLLILPNSRDGLSTLECQLQNVTLNQLSTRLTPTKVQVDLPSFKIEFTIELIPVLQELGIHVLFEDSADLSGIFESGPSMKVTGATHKAFIEVNEAGSEAAAATVITISVTSVILNPKQFKADHPFVFAIKSSEAVYFVGHVVEL